MFDLRVRYFPRMAFRFAKDEKGSMTIFGLFFFFVSGILGALALDVTNLYAQRTHLQVAADQAAHAAIYNRAILGDEDAAKQKAIDLVKTTLPPERYGVTIQTGDIVFGTFNEKTRVFLTSAEAASAPVDLDARQAVRAVTSFTEGRSNSAAAFLFRLIGFDDFDIVTSAIFTEYPPGCLNEGFVAQGVVELQSNNVYSKGFCVHSNTYVSINQNNTFDAGTIVSMPDIANLDLPQSGFELNEGLDVALRNGSVDIRVLSRVENMIHRYRNGTPTEEPLSEYPFPDVAADTEEWPDYIADYPFDRQSVTTTNITTGEAGKNSVNLAKNAVHIVKCTQGAANKNSTLTIDATTSPLADVIIITDCQVKFTNGSTIENARVISTSTSDGSISSPSGLQIGRKDGCDPGGEAQLITMGGMDFPAALSMNGAQLIAQKDIAFAANADGINGVSMIAGGRIDGTSNMNMALCGTGTEGNITIPYFRMSQ